VAFYEQLRSDEPPAVSRRRAFLGALLAVAGVALGIAALLLWRDQPSGTPTVSLPTGRPSAVVTPSAQPTAAPTSAPTAAPTTAPTTVPSASAAPLPSPVVPVTVLNNSKVKGLADRSSRKFSAGGWPVAATGNYRGGTIAQTTVYYAPGQLGSAQRFAKQFGIDRVLPRFSGLPGKGLTVVLTRDYG
jgi:hypothetical protein